MPASPASLAPSVPATHAPAAGVDARRVAVASAVGTTIEWYDFFIYGTAAAKIGRAHV